MKGHLIPLTVVSAVLFFLPSFTCAQVLQKHYLQEVICWDYNYGTILGNYYKIRDADVCGVKCTEKSECISYLYRKGAGWCVLNSAKFLNRISVGCSYMADYSEIVAVIPPRQLRPPDRCVSVPYIPGIIVNKASGNFSIGSQLPYRCDPCTSFPPASSPGYIECGIDGNWIIPTDLCVYGPSVGLLKNGSAIPVDALGCVVTFGDTSCSGSVTDGLRFDGSVGRCYCDGVCCSAGDCCFDTECYQTSKIYDYDYYYYYYY